MDNKSAFFYVPFFSFFLFSFLLAPSFSQAAEYSVSSDTIIRVFERDTADKKDALVNPVYEYLQVDTGNKGEAGVSFHGYGWGRADLGDGDYFSDDTDGELLYGYLEYAGDWNDLNLRLGRQHIFFGVSNESLDGLSGSTDITSYFSIAAYAGYPVALNNENGHDGDSLVGGRIEHHMGTLYQIGSSYQRVANDGDRAEETLGIDMSFALPGGINLQGHSTRNLETDGWAEHYYDLQFTLSDFHVQPFFQHFQYEDYFSDGIASANPFRYLADTGETLTVFGGDLSWYKSLNWETAFAAKSYDYDIRDESSQFFSGQVTWHKGEDLTQIGAEIGYMHGDTAETNYVLGRTFVFWDLFLENLPPFFVSWDLLFVSYDEDINGEDSSLFSSLGVGAKFMNESLSVALTGDYSKDPYFDNDIRGQLVVSYKFGKVSKD